jgi:hypothetical protein
MRCDWTIAKQDGDRRQYACKRCGGRTAMTTATPESINAVCRLGVGDVIAAGLHAIGFRKKCGGCQKRQAALNELGKKVGL